VGLGTSLAILSTGYWYWIGARAMAVTLLGTPGLPWTDSNGDPLNGGLINAYEPGTTTRRNTYPTRSDADAGSNANTNPVVLSSTGIAEIWLDSRYKIIVTDSGGTTIDTIDEVGTLTGADVFDRDHIAGMLVSLDADAAHDINVTSGECRDSADSFDISRAAEYTKKIDADWAAGDDAGGLAEHAVTAVANNTIYYIWAIAKSGDNTSDFLISTSNSSPTMPTDYDKKRLIGVTKTDGSANLERVSNIERTGFSAVWPDSGSADAYVITPLPALTAYASGARFSFIAENACTGATTINVSALGTKAIQANGSALTGGEIGAAKLVMVEYSAGAFQIVSGSSSSAASATAAGIVELATDAEVTTGSDTARAVTPAGLHQKTTSATAIGLVELATDAEVTTGSDTARAVTPAGLHQKTSSATAIGLVELATDAEVTTGSDTARAVTAAGLHQKTSSATAIGLVELATVAEVLTGTDTSRAVTAAGVFGPRDEHRSVTNSITAGSTQTQAGATAMTAGYNRVTVSGTDGDGVKLPTAAEGLIVHVVNDDSAQTIQVWPATSDAVDGGSANAVDANVLGFGESRTYFAVDATNWYTVNDMPAATATVAGKVELATNAEVTTGSDTARAVTAAGLHQKTASATVVGLVEFATTAETATGTDAGRSVTPDGLHDMTTLSGAAWMKDEDNMASNSATVVASQQSIKAYVDASGGAASPMFKNLWHNGDFKITQRGTSATGLGATDGYYVMDGINYQNVSGETGRYTASQSTTVPANTGHRKSLKIDITTADVSIAAGHIYYLALRIEAQECSHLKYGESGAASLAISFWVRSTTIGDYQFILQQHDTSRSYSATYNIADVDTWEKKTIIIAGDTSGVINDDTGLGLSMNFTLTGGSTYQGGTEDAWASTADNMLSAGSTVNLFSSTSNDWYIAGLQIEVGSSATDFEFEPHSVTLDRCRRYLWRSVPGANLHTFCVGFNTGTTLSRGEIMFPTTMRAAPTMTTTGTAGDYTINYSSTSSACSSIPAFDGASGLDQAGTLYFNVASGMTQGGASRMQSTTTTGYLQFESEL
jgi:hypothetical protein